jgi:phage gpG-like protein
MPASRATLGFGLPGDFGTSIDIDFVPPVSLLIADVLRLGVRLRTFREPLEKAVREVVIPSFKRTWEAEGRPEPWHELSPYTIARKTGESMSIETAGFSGGSGAPILVSTPIQRERGQHKSEGRGGALKVRATSFKIWTFTKDSAYVSGAGIFFYGPIHQLGASSARIPARPFLILQDEDLDKIEKVFLDWEERKLLEFSAGI